MDCVDEDFAPITMFISSSFLKDCSSPTTFVAFWSWKNNSLTHFSTWLTTKLWPRSLASPHSLILRPHHPLPSPWYVSNIIALKNLNLVFLDIFESFAYIFIYTLSSFTTFRYLVILLPTSWANSAGLARLGSWRWRASLFSFHIQFDSPSCSWHGAEQSRASE